MLTHLNKAELAAAPQRPLAIVLGCSDARVPAEVVFDQGLGALFVIRVAGHVVAPSVVGSVEFAASRFGTRLVVVLGHSQCGAVLATLEAVESGRALEGSLGSIVGRIRPAVEGLLGSTATAGRDELVRACVRANVRAAADHLRHGSSLLEDLERDQGLVMVGAEYDLETGRVLFFDGVPVDWEEPPPP
jgi:carbonic anhydrase